MRVMRNGKLVRDRIPELITQRGEAAITSVLAPGDFADALSLKLVEEAEEFQASRSAEELADVLEVLRALASTLGMSMEDIESIRRKKEFERGAFDGRIWLQSSGSPSE